jgi:sugar phosphate isomerase/epimerase
MKLERSRLRFAIGTVILQESMLTPILASIANAGFKQIELLCESPHFGEPQLSVSEVREQMEQHGLSMDVAHGPYVHVDCGAPDETERQHAVDWIASFFDPMAALGATCIVVHPNRHTNREAPEKSRLETRQSLIELADRAGERGLRLALENLMLYQGRRAGDSVKELLEIIDGLPPNVGLCLDTGHAAIAQRDPAEELRLGGQRIFHLHLHDNDGTYDHHWVPGDGIIRFDDVIQTMQRTGFSGSATIEVVSKPDNIEDVLTRCRQLAQRWSAALSAPPFAKG